MAAGTSAFSNLSGYVGRVAKLLRLDAALLAVETRRNLQSVAVSLGCMHPAWAAGLLIRRPEWRSRMLAAPSSTATIHPVDVRDEWRCGRERRSTTSVDRRDSFCR